MNKKIIFMIILTGIVLFSIFNISALGLTPARTNFNFEPSLKKTVSFSIVNSEKKDMNLEVYTRGELMNYVTLERDKISMSSSEESRQLSYSVNLPDKLSPGLHTAEIIIAQPSEAASGDSYIGATLAVATQLYINVPYPGKYAEADLKVINKNGETQFIIPISNMGEFDLVNVKANIEVYNDKGEKINTINTESVEIKSKEKREVIGVLTPALAGNYKAIVTIIYDGETLRLEKEFSSYEQGLELQQIEVKDFQLGNIAKFEMLVENMFTKEISGAYSQTNIFNEKGELMADFKSQTYDLPANSKKVLTSYWDTKGVKEGMYNSKVFLKYSDKSYEKELKFEVSENEIRVIGVGYVISQSGSGGVDMVFILTILVVILVVMNLAWFFFLRKKMNKKQ